MGHRFELDYKNLSKRIKAIRTERGLTQEQLANNAGLSWNFVARIETNNAKISLQTLVNIANALNISIDFLLLHDTTMIESKEKTSVDILIDEMLKEFSETDKELLIDTINVIRLHKNKRGT